LAAAVAAALVAQVPVLARRPREVEVLAPAQLPVVRVVRVRRLVPAELAGSRAGAAAQPPVVSAAMAGSTPRPRATYAGTEIKVTTERPSVSLTLTEMDSGSWVIFELPGFTTAASGAPQNSLDGCARPATPSYFKDKDALG